MDNSVYITLSKQLALFRDMDVTSNNIANSNTTGYNGEHVLFTSYVTKDNSQGNVNSMSFAHDISSYRNTDNGSIKITGNDLDVAIQGNGYFQVETPLGVRYTRAGNFQIAGDGTLTSSEGYPVLNVSGQHISLPDNTTNVVIGEGGNMKVNGDDFDTIGVVQFDNPRLMERLDSKLYKSEVTPQPAEDARVMQGSLEASNVQPVSELTHMMSVSRAVSDTAQFIAIIYDLERKAASAWAQPAQ